MQAFSEFKNVPPSFWALVKYISETLGYTYRKTKTIRTYSDIEIIVLLKTRRIEASDHLISQLK